MAQTASMAPPLSPREPRRSNRRSVPSASTSTSKSSGSPSPDSITAPALKDSDHSSSASRSGASATTTSSRAKRLKEGMDEPTDDLRHRVNPSVSSTNSPVATNSTKRTKRKGKDKASQLELYIDTTPIKSSDVPHGLPIEAEEGDEDAGITRCVCGGNGDEDPDAGEFMIQCEMCEVWQHGLCMGFPSEAQAPQGDYYCEECKPEDHVELLRKLHKRQRQSSTHSHHTVHRGASRSSRSHSPSHNQKASKRRNTMNSRDAAYEESLKEILGATAAEAAGGAEGSSKEPNGSTHGAEESLEEIVENGQGGRRKRKRTDEESVNNKRKRSASSASEHPIASAVNDTRVDTSVTGSNSHGGLPPPPPPPAKASSSRVKRSAARKTAAESVVGADGDEGGSSTNSKKHPNQYTYRGKLATTAQQKRAPASYASPSSNGAMHEHGTRRNANNSHNTGSMASGTMSVSVSGSGAGAGPSRSAYYQNVPQQPLFTTWGLPDYLAHLQSILPSDVPPPLEIRGPSFSNEGESVMTERGVKVKWPAKRMSVTDMNKRVRAMVEWVGREQAGATERERRKTALERALAANKTTERELATAEAMQDSQEEGEKAQVPMTLDGASLTESPLREEPKHLASDCTSSPNGTGERVLDSALSSRVDDSVLNQGPRQSTMKLMEELMEDLILFQERFGPAAKGRTKDRANRTLAVS